MKMIARLACLVALWPATDAAAQLDVYLCVDEDGRRTYQNTERKGCKKISAGPSIVPQPRSSVDSGKGASGSGVRDRPRPDEQEKAREAQESTGTAFFVAVDGRAVTNWHVVEGCAFLEVIGYGSAQVVRKDQASDLAMIALVGSRKPHGGEPVVHVAPIASEATDVVQGEDVFVFGFPLAGLLATSGNITPGIVSAMAGPGNNSAQIQITAPIQPGSSGSPVVSGRGEVVGVAVSALSTSKLLLATGSAPQNANFAVAGRTLRRFLLSAGVVQPSRESNSVSLLPTLTVPEITRQAKRWTALIRCTK